jgi:hypothetical protein
MLFAFDDNYQRISPQKGISAICPICKEEVVSVCGDINIHHWRHLNTINCDPWIEPETEWHRHWKSQFPKNWQEVVIDLNNERHRADIQTSSGLVLELQNSSISNRTIQERENFYENMIWLINAEIFAKNFSIRSRVISGLRELGEHYNYYSNLKKDIDDELKPLIKSQDKINGELERTISTKVESEKKIDKLKTGHVTIDVEVNDLLNTNFHFGIYMGFSSTNISLIQDLKQKFKKIEKEIDEKTSQINTINQLPDSLINNYYSYKRVAFKQVKSESFAICKVVKTTSISDIFPMVIDLKSESNFRWYEQQSNQYTLIIDLTENLSNIKMTLQKLENKQCEIVIAKDNAFSTLKKEMQEWLDLSIQKLQQDITDCDKKVEFLMEEMEQTRLEIIYERERFEKESIENEKLIAKEIKKKEIAIKTNLKGLYSYSWRYRRPSWNYANATLFLDFGESIFEILNENQFKKISKSDFIGKVISWK